MNASGAAQPTVAALPAEDVARAELYGLLARLFYAAPGEDLLNRMAASAGAFGNPNSPIGAAWGVLCEAARRADAHQLGFEYDEHFIGTGRATVSVYASHYLTETFKELRLVSLREQLEAMGLARQSGVAEPEDHVSGLFDVMRHLVLRGGDDASIAAQKAFFEAWIGPWRDAFSDAVEGLSESGFYRAAALLLRTFLAVEAEAFVMA